MRFKFHCRALHRGHFGAGHLVPGCERLGMQFPFLFGISVVAAVVTDRRNGATYVRRNGASNSS